MTWRDLGTFSLTSDWQFTPNITSSIVRITHLNVASTLNIRGLIAQAISQDISFFDLRSFRQRTEKEVFLMLNFEGLLIKKLAIRRTDLTDIDWNIKIEELEGVSDINLPLGIADVSGLQAALSGKANTNHQHQIIDVAGLETALSEKNRIDQVHDGLIQDLYSITNNLAPEIHRHGIEDIDELANELNTILGVANSKAPTNHQHQITEITGLEAELSAKAIASDVNTALSGKAPTNHQHAIVNVTGLETALSEKAIASVVETALAGKAPINIITSTSAPASPFSGLIWNEVAVNEELIEAWRYVNSKWQSLTKYKIDYFGASTAITGTSSYHLPLDTRYNYLFKDFLVHCLYSAGTVDVGNYWRAIITTQPSGTTFADSGAIGGDNLSKRYPLNYLFTPASGERLIFNPQKLGAAPSAKIAMSLTYHLVRK
jgi:Phage tail repeat like